MRLASVICIVAALALSAAILAADGSGGSKAPAKGVAPAPTGTPEVYTAWPFDAKEAAKRQADTAKALGKPREMVVDVGGINLKFILIPAGKFAWGGGIDGKGCKEATISKPFYMGEFTVAQAQYTKVMGKNPSLHPGETLPVDSVKWDDAVEFCRKASAKSKKSIRLPTEMEWEDACRAGTATKCYWGDDMSVMGDYCWWHDNCEGKTHPVGEKKPNAWGLFDMMGNSWQWCGAGKEADEKAASGAAHPMRGATFGSKVPMFYSGSRMELAADKVNDRFGMRVMMDVE